LVLDDLRTGCEINVVFGLSPEDRPQNARGPLGYAFIGDGELNSAGFSGSTDRDGPIEVFSFNDGVSRAPKKCEKYTFNLLAVR